MFRGFSYNWRIHINTLISGIKFFWILNVRILNINYIYTKTNKINQLSLIRFIEKLISFNIINYFLI